MRSEWKVRLSKNLQSEMGAKLATAVKESFIPRSRQSSFSGVAGEVLYVSCGMAEANSHQRYLGVW